MFGRRKRLREAEARVDQLLALRREDARKHAGELETERRAKVTACLLAAEQSATVIRVSGRVQKLEEHLAVLGETVDAEYLAQLESRVLRLVRACARYRADAAQQRTTHGREAGRMRDPLGHADEQPQEHPEEVSA